MTYQVICKKPNQEPLIYNFRDEYYANITKEEKIKEGFTVDIISKAD